MSKFIKCFDFYGKGIKFFIEGKTKIKTLIGGYLSLMTVFVLVAFSWLVGNDIFFKEKPRTFYEQKIIGNYPKLLINRSIFPLAFALTDKYKQPVFNQKFIHYELKKYEYKKSEITGLLELSKVFKIDLKPCILPDFPMISESLFKEAQLGIFYCPNDEDIFVEGFLTEGSMTYMRLSVKKCDYDLYPNFCENQENIDRFISETLININLITVESNLFLTNFSDTINPTLQLTYKFLPANNLKIIDFMIQENRLYTDNGILLESYEEKKFLKMIETQTDSIDYTIKSKELIQLNFYSSNKLQNHYRYYIKITDILAAMGGLIKVWVIFFSFLNIPFGHFEKFNLIYENIFKNENNFNHINNNYIPDGSKSNLFHKNEKNKNFFFNNQIIQSKSILSQNKIFDINNANDVLDFDKNVINKNNSKILRMNKKNINSELNYVDFNSNNNFIKNTFNNDPNNMSSIDFLAKNHQNGNFAFKDDYIRSNKKK